MHLEVQCKCLGSASLEGEEGEGVGWLVGREGGGGEASISEVEFFIYLLFMTTINQFPGQIQNIVSHI